LGSLLISATVEASNFKFGTQIGFGTSLPKKTVKTKIGEAWARRASGKKWNPLFISATVEKLVHNMSSGLPCQTQVLGPD